MTPEDAFCASLRADPTQNPQRLAKELGLSGRARRRIMGELEAEGVVRSRTFLRGAIAVVAVAVVSGGLWLMLGRDAPEQGRATDRAERRPLSPEAAKVERDLYKAIDERDPARVQDAVAQLESEDEPLRLAALRYLVTVRATEQTGVMLALLDDPSERVRTAAVQLVAALPGREVDHRLAEALADAKRSLGERSVAAAGLEGRSVEEPLAVARLVLPALLDESLPLRENTARLLTKLTSRSLDVDLRDRDKAHAAWRSVVGVAE